MADVPSGVAGEVPVKGCPVVNVEVPLLPKSFSIAVDLDVICGILDRGMRLRDALFDALLLAAIIAVHLLYPKGVHHDRAQGQSREVR